MDDRELDLRLKFIEDRVETIFNLLQNQDEDINKKRAKIKEKDER